MSNPLSNLRKGRKAPLVFNSGSQNSSVPFRKTPEYTHDETSLLAEVTSNMAASRMSRSTPLPKLFPQNPSTTSGSPRQSVTPATAPSNHDLMSLMMTRLGTLEARISQQASQLAAKDKKNQILEDKVKILQKARDEGNPGRCHELEKQCLRLQKQVHQMEAFLADYGMIWVGQKTDEDEISDDGLESVSDEGSPESTVWRPGASVPGGEFHVDYDVILKHIEELNVLAGDGIAKIQHTTDGARLKMPDPIQMTLYANGIVLFSGPFRPFTDPTTQTCVQDLMDGFFPSELQHRYPDGIPFSVTDKRNVYFRDRLSEGFTGVGQVLGGETKPSRLIPTNLEKSTSMHTNLQEESTLPGPKLSADQFLNKVPSSVIKDGKVIDVRSGLADMIKGSSQSKITVVETSAVQEMKDRLALDENSRPPSSRQVTTLRIRSDSGDTFIVKMRFAETIGDLRDYLNKQMPTVPQYQIMSTFPSQTYTDNGATLEQCGLVPNATLHLRILKK